MGYPLTFQGRPVPEEGQQQNETAYGITKITRIRFFGRWMPVAFWEELMHTLSGVLDGKRLITVRSFRTPKGIILTDIDIAGELDHNRIRKLEDEIIKSMERSGVNVRRFLKIEIRERPSSLFVSQD